MRHLLLLVFVVCSAAIGVPGAFAQERPTVTLTGSVRDVHTRDSYIPGATVTVTSHRTGQTFTLLTTGDGTFTVDLDPGTYTIAVSSPGYRMLVARNFCAAAGRPAQFHAVVGRLQPGAPRTAPRTFEVLPSVNAPQAVASVASLSPDEIEQAMAFGRTAKKLEAPQLNASGTLLGRRTGHLFTPFWRVATMTQVAAAAKQKFTAGEIPAAFVQKTAWVVARPTEHYEDSHGDMDSPQYLAPAAEIVIRLPRSDGPERDVQPLWVMPLGTMCDVDALASVLGQQFKRYSVLAAFPIDGLQAGGTIVVTYRKSAYSADGFRSLRIKEETRRVRISERDLRNWR
jgi:hypothetical protein